MAELEELIESALRNPANVDLLVRDKPPASEMEEMLMEALRCEAEQRPRIGVKRPFCEMCGTRRTPTYPCKKCHPEDWNERYRISRARGKVSP